MDALFGKDAWTLRTVIFDRSLKFGRMLMDAHFWYEVHGRLWTVILGRTLKDAGRSLDGHWPDAVRTFVDD